MTQTKTYNFDKEYLILNEMSAHYIYSEKPFSYYDSSRHSGKPCPKTKKVPFWGKVQFQKKLDHSKHKGNRIYTYKCNIYCDHACIALSNITLDAPSQIWLNGKLAFAQRGFWQLNGLLAMSKGINIFEIVTDSHTIPSVTIRLFKGDRESKPSFTSRLYQSYMFTERLIDVATNGDVFMDGGLKNILVTKLEIRDMPDTYRLVIEDSDKRVYQELNVAFSETYTFDTATLPQGTGDFLFYLMRIYIGELDTGYYSIVFRGNLAKSMEEIALCAREYLRIHGKDGQIELRIEELLNDLNDVDFQKEWMHYAEEIQELKELLQRTKSDQDTIDGKILYRSRLDDKPKHILYTVSGGKYDANKKYPLFAHIALYDYEYWSKKFVGYTDNAVIFADIVGRGVNFGAYVGEAAILEQIEVLKQHFSIDENRVYLSGFCGAAGSALQMAQAYPHMFAGFLVYIPQQDFSLRMNLYNVDILAFYHAEEYVHGIPNSRVQQYYDELPKLVQLPVKGITHNDFLSLTAKADTINYMLTKERCAYPQRLFYKTWMARHRTAYWITLDNIQRGAKVAEIQAEVDGNAIQIHTVGTDGLKIQIPPYLREYKDICVSINEHKRVLAMEELPTQIHVSISDAGWGMTTESVPFSAKGTGLLDVYCNPVRVLYNSGNLQSIADVFAHPICTGFNPKLLVDYPMINLQKCDALPGDSSYVILEDVHTECAMIKELVPICPVQYDSTGYNWNNERHDEEYCIWQILESPYASDQRVLLISSNNWAVFKKFLFFRHLILPTYLNGPQSFLNNEILLLTRHGIYAAYENGGELVKV